MMEKEKHFLHEIYSAFDKLESIAKPKELGNMHLRNVFQLDVYRFLLYLSSSDGRLAPAERDLMNELFDTEYTTDDLVNYIENNNIYSREFENTPPLSMVIALASDAALHQIDPNAPILFLALLKFFQAVGLELLVCDGRIDDQEKDDLITYMNTLKKLVENAKPEEEYGKISRKK